MTQRAQPRSRSSGPRRDTGAVSLEIAILAPALLLVVFTIVQTGLWFYARNLAHAVIELTAKVKRVEALADDMDHDADLLDQTDDLRLHLIAIALREDATRLRTALNGDAA